MMEHDEILRHITKHTGFGPEAFKGGASRQHGDFSRVGMILSNNGQHLVVHKQSTSDEVVLEVHDEYDNEGQQREQMVTLCYSLTPGQRYDLAMYLLKNINVLE